SHSPTSTRFPYTTLFRSREKHHSRGDSRWALRIAPEKRLLQHSRNRFSREWCEREKSGSGQGGIMGKARKERSSNTARVLQFLRSEEHTSELQSRGHLVC